MTPGSRLFDSLEGGTDPAEVTEAAERAATLLVRGEHLFFVGDTGFAECRKTATGEKVWAERLGAKFTASPILVDGNIFAASEDTTSVMRVE